ncbi:serine hydrolase domain-containing protein [Mesorhizobium amorphae]|uniref:serine hydrolase domain-containing protein n=1 Tax=Mesorhizobium amorphae TaxID=71433 RepID=UPI00164268B8|nr:serine hydrolase domain-containing protein [Mesorhizobium amorphae]
MTSIEIVTQRLRALADEFTQHWPIPGGIIVAVSRDETLLELPFGLANIDARQPVTRDHLFAIGSISKGFVGLTLLQLAEEGKVDLDAPVTTYLPGSVSARTTRCSRCAICSTTLLDCLPGPTPCRTKSGKAGG